MDTNEINENEITESTTDEVKKDAAESIATIPAFTLDEFSGDGGQGLGFAKTSSASIGFGGVSIDTGDPFSLIKEFLSSNFVLWQPGAVMPAEEMYRAYQVWSTYTGIPVVNYRVFKSKMKKFLEGDEGASAKEFLQGLHGPDFERMMEYSRGHGLAGTIKPSKWDKGEIGRECELLYWRGRYPGSRSGVVVGVALNMGRVKEVYRLIKKEKDRD